MRYRGGGVGHKSTRDATNKFLTDRDMLDVQVPTTADKDVRLGFDTNSNIGEEGASDSDSVEITDGESRENVCAEKEPDPNEDNLNDESDSEDDEGRDEAEFEEEFDYGLPGGDGSDNEDDEEADDADEDALGPEDGDEVHHEEDDNNLGYADL